MPNCIFLLLLIALKCAIGNILIESDPVTNYGSYANVFSYCPEDSYANGFELKTHPGQGGMYNDDTSLNAIRLLCANENAPSNVTAKIMSNEGNLGNWGKVVRCPGGFIHAFQLRQEKEQGEAVYKNNNSRKSYYDLVEANDDTATNNLRVFCGKYAAAFQGDGNIWGDWGSIKRCNSGQRVCGINTQIDDDKQHGSLGINPKDYTGLNNVQMECCDVPVTTTERACV